MENLPREIQKMILHRLLPPEIEARERLFDSDADLNIPEWYSFMVKGSVIFNFFRFLKIFGKLETDPLQSPNHTSCADHLH